MRGYFRWSPEKVEKLREMKHAGETNANIAIHFNTTRQSVESACNKHGIKLKKSLNIKSRSDSATLRKQAEALLKAASEMEERESFNKHKRGFVNKLNEIINDYEHLGEKIKELKEMLK